MTKLCIILAVFLVSVIFGMADMEIRSQKEMSVQEDGSWHAVFRGLSEEQIAFIKARPEIKTAASYAVTNYRLDKDFFINGKKTAVCGFEKDFLQLFPAIHITKGEFPSEASQAVITENASKELLLEPGDSFELETPDGSPLIFEVSGITTDTAMMKKYDAYGIFLNMDSYRSCFSAVTEQTDYELYIEFKSLCPIQKTLNAISADISIPKSQIGENTKLLGLMFQSGNSYIKNLYLTAAVLALLVITAGILMIANSLNSQIAKRTEFFGMLRCLGASPGQIRRFVRAEAMSWCKTAIPAGLVLSVLIIWVLCALLKYISPSYFSGMPVFAVSWISLLAGTLMGILTVLISVQAPARKASRVSPLTAVSGNAGSVPSVKKAAGTDFVRIPLALGFHHAKGNRKNLVLMTSSFAFTVILFLSFTTAVDFMNHAIIPLRPYTPDVSIYCDSPDSFLPNELLQKAAQNPAVDKIYGRKFKDAVSVITGEGQEHTLNLISYEDLQFHWAEKALLEGSLESTRKGTAVLVDHTAAQYLKTGTAVSINTTSVTVEGTLSHTPFKSDQGVIICSEALFDKLAGAQNYSVLDIQLKRNASEKDLSELKALAGDGITFSDSRLSNQNVLGAYVSFSIFIYGFLLVIALIGIFNIVNTMGMSVSARLPQFGAMQAVGMTVRQLTQMILAEAAVYVTGGIAAGLLVGLPINHFLYGKLITSRWGEIWKPPVPALIFIVLLMAGAILPAVRGPIKQIKKMSVVDVIHHP